MFSDDSVDGGGGDDSKEHDDTHTQDDFADE